MTPTEVIAFAKNKGARILDLRFMDFPVSGSTSVSRSGSSLRSCSRMVMALMAPVFAAGRLSTPATCSSSPIPNQPGLIRS